MKKEARIVHTILGLGSGYVPGIALATCPFPLTQVHLRIANGPIQPPTLPADDAVLFPTSPRGNRPLMSLYAYKHPPRHSSQ